MSKKHIRFDKDESEDYSPSDSEDDYDENEKDLLAKVRNRKKDSSDDDDEVLGVDSDNEAQSDIALSDVEGQNDDDLPDARAWGKDKKKYYWTDYVDQDYGGFQGKDAALAELEEEEAKNLQKQLVQQLDDGDFSLEMFTKKETKQAKDQVEEVIKTDVSKLSQRQKLQLLKKESPEFFELVEDFKTKINIVRTLLKPVLTLSTDEKIKKSTALDFITTYQNLILNYCTNICMYLLLKSSRVPIQHHPIVKRLFQYRQHISQIEPIFEEIIKPQIESILEMQTENFDKTKKPKKLKLLSKLIEKSQPAKEKTTEKETKQDEEVITEETEDLEETVEKRVKFANNDDSSDSEEVEQEEEEAEEKGEKILEGKRAITYQMSKNKGLTPHRKKEQRNPRVKHRNKFKKAKVRRKGAVREVRRETSRYGGEMSGIKAHVTKSVKIK